MSNKINYQCSNCGRREQTNCAIGVAEGMFYLGYRAHGDVMTDEQANNITREQAIRILHPDTSIEAVDDYEEAGNYEHAYDTACLMAVDALRGPQPDPETGLVRCGCGGKAIIWPSDLRQAMVTAYQVGCIECAMTTVWVRGKQENAMNVWNTAMGWKGGAE